MERSLDKIRSKENSPYFAFENSRITAKMKEIFIDLVDNRQTEHLLKGKGIQISFIHEGLYKFNAFGQNFNHKVAKTVKRTRPLIFFCQLKLLDHYHIFARIIHQKSRELLVVIAKNYLSGSFFKSTADLFDEFVFFKICCAQI